MPKNKMLTTLTKTLRSAGLLLEVRQDTGGVPTLVSLPSNRRLNRIILQIDEQAETEVTAVGVDSGLRQAVIKIKEKKRKTEQRLVLFTNSKKAKIPTHAWREKSRIRFPPRTTFSIKGARSIYASFYDDMEYEHHATLVAAIPETEVFLLVGFDEGHTFVSMLPCAVTSVAKAHVALMPEDVVVAKREKRKVLRSGEFFLIEATQKESKEIVPSMKRALMGCCHTEMEKLKDHEPMAHAVYKGKIYVSGAIGNKRHFLALNGWFRVSKNKEVAAPLEAESWD